MPTTHLPTLSCRPPVQTTILRVTQVLGITEFPSWVPPPLCRGHKGPHRPYWKLLRSLTLANVKPVFVTDFTSTYKHFINMYHSVWCEALTAVTSCSPADAHPHTVSTFNIKEQPSKSREITSCLHLVWSIWDSACLLPAWLALQPWRQSQDIPLKHQRTSAALHGITSLKTAFGTIVMRASEVINRSSAELTMNQLCYTPCTFAVMATWQNGLVMIHSYHFQLPFYQVQTA
jgi:hypothetical protein